MRTQIQKTIGPLKLQRDFESNKVSISEHVVCTYYFFTTIGDTIDTSMGHWR